MQETLTNRPLFSPEEFEIVLFDSNTIRKRMKEEMEEKLIQHIDKIWEDIRSQTL